MDFPFGPLAPDQGEMTPGILLVADGVQPLADGYGPFPAVTVSGSAGALSAAPRGMLSYQLADGSWRTVAGTATTVEQMAADFTWSSIDTGLTVTSGDDLCFARFGTKLLYTDTTDGLRAYDVETPAAASAIAAAKNPRWLFECGNILFGLDCVDDGGLRNNRLIRSSAFSDHTNWTTKGADFQPLESGGALIWGGKLTDNTALILQQRAVRLIQVGGIGTALWGIQSISEEFGAIGAKSCIAFDGMVFWFATDGFRMWDGGPQPVRIGAGLIDQYFLGLVDQSDLSLIQGTIDPFRKNVLWRWKRSSNASTSVFEDIIGYNWAFKRWFTLAVETTYLAFSAQAAATWDAYDPSATWDSLSSGLVWDSRLLQGGQPLFGALNASFKFGYFSGASLAATLQTSVSDSPTSELINWAKPIDDSPDGTVQLGVKDQLSNSTTWKTGVAKVASGRVALRGRGEDIAFQRNIDAGSAWSYSKGIDQVSAVSGGPR